MQEQELGPAALRLYDIYGHGMPQLWLQDDVQLHPYAHLMAILIMAMKLCFCLDVPGPGGSSEGQPDWQAWARAALQRARGPAGFPVTTLEVRARSHATDEGPSGPRLKLSQGMIEGGN